MTTLASQIFERDWLPVGEEPQPVGSIAHYVVLRNNGASVLSLPNGDIDSDREPSSGMYYRDTRYLSRLQLSFGGVSPILLDAREDEHGLSAIFTNPAIRSHDGGMVVAAQSLVLRRKRVLTEGIVESLTVSNYGRHPVEVDLRVEFDADFCDIFVVRGYERQSPTPLVQAECRPSAVCFRYRGVDGVERRTSVSFTTPPAALAPNEAVFLLQLEPGQTSSIAFEIEAEREHVGHGIASAQQRVWESQRDWLAGLTSVRTDHEAVNAMLQRSLLDIEALRTREGDDDYIAAGVPWYDTIFGRDSLITGMQLLAFTPDVLRAALVVLARYQAKDTDAVHDATPGKIPHELRWGELANAGEVPFGRYYGSVDGTPLFIVAALEYLRWTGDIQTVGVLWPALEAAYRWCLTAQDGGVDGFLAYSRKSAAGLENQGWKDSHDAIVWPDGRLVESPIALVEVQAYLVAALSAFAQLAAAIGAESAAGAQARAEKLRARFHDSYANDELGFVLCLDGQRRPVPTPSSNAGHVLWCGVAHESNARQVADRLFASDLFSGWGVRTLGSRVGGFNPLGYHVGSVWPHDNALILHGLRTYGFDEHAERLAAALFQMALGFPEYRVPELFSGDDRELRTVPTPYPVASRPHAWAAASIPYVLTSMLGIRPGGAGKLWVVRPMLPMGLGWVQLLNLRLGGGSVDLTFRATGRHVSVEVENIRGGIEVVLSETWPDGVSPGVL